MRDIRDLLVEDGRERTSTGFSSEEMYRCWSGKHEDKKGSLSVNCAKGVYFCHACGMKGNVLDYLKEHRQMNLRDAISIAKSYGWESRSTAASAPAAKRRLMTELPEEYICYYYHEMIAGDNRIAMAVCRRDTDDGKIIRQFTPVYNDQGKFQGYLPKGLKKNIPLYGIDAGEKDFPMLVVEGEKTADRMADFCLGKWDRTTWAGGCKAWKKTNWAPLLERQKVLFLADADTEGRIAMCQIADYLAKRGMPKERLHFILPPGESGWDIADLPVRYSKHFLNDWLEAEARSYESRDEGGYKFPPKVSQPPDKPEPPPPPAGSGGGNTPPEQTAAEKIEKHPNLLFLGHREGDPVVYNRQLKQIDIFSPTSFGRYVLCLFGEKSLLEIVGVQKIVHVKPMHKEWLFSLVYSICLRRGAYSPDRERGLGASFDGKKIVYHLGDRLLVDAQEKPLDAMGLKNIYEQRAAIRPPGIEATADQRKRMHDAVCALAWQDPLDGTLLMGWTAAAVICGVLEWRPQLWISGAAGRGKTWLLANVVMKIFDGHIDSALGKSFTAAYLRRKVGSNSLPFVCDEAEVGNNRDALSTMLKMARLSARGDSAEGRADPGSLKGFYETRPRSCFLLASINIKEGGLEDDRRFTVLKLRGKAEQLPHDDFLLVAAEITEAFKCGHGLRDFFIQRIELLLDLGEKARTYLGENYADHTSGNYLDTDLIDQLAALAPGAFLCQGNDGCAGEHMQKYHQLLDQLADYCGGAANREGIPDNSDALLGHLLAQSIIVRGVPVSVAQLLRSAVDERDLYGIDGPNSDHCRTVLEAHGFRLGGRRGGLAAGEIFIPTRHAALRRLLRGTPWENARLGDVLGQGSFGEQVQLRTGTDGRRRGYKFTLDELLEIDPSGAVPARETPANPEIPGIPFGQNENFDDDIPL